MSGLVLHLTISCSSKILFKTTIHIFTEVINLFLWITFKLWVLFPKVFPKKLCFFDFIHYFSQNYAQPVDNFVDIIHFILLPLNIVSARA